MAIVTLDSLTDATLSENSLVFIGNKYKTTLEKLEGYFNPYGSFSYGGRSLLTVLGVSSFAAAITTLKARADAGIFAGLRPGDYLDIPSLTINGTTINNNSFTKNLRIVIYDFDYFYRAGDTDMTTHHIVMGFENCPILGPMNETNTNEGGYEASQMCKDLDGINGFWKAALQAAGIPLKTIKLFVETAKNNWGWYAHTVFLPSTIMVYGHRAWAENELGYTANGQPMQLALYKVAPWKRIKFYNGSRHWWWQQNPAYAYTDTAACFCYGHGDGSARYNGASGSGGVSPLFII